MNFFAISIFPVILLVAFDATAKMTNDFVEAVIQGRQLAQQILAQKPAESFTNTGVLNIRDANGRTLEVPVQCTVIVTATDWQSVYTAFLTNGTETLRVVPSPIQANPELIGGPDWKISRPVFFPNLTNEGTGPWFSDQRNIPVSGRSNDVRWQSVITTGPEKSFAGSDFSIGDLGLEFFYWPQQKILKHEMRRGRSCKVLESTNPNPSPNGYSRVVSWIDNETLGLVQAEAYDAKGKLLKEFYPKTFKKVNGQWELQEMQIRNDQTGSRTRLEFDLKSPD